MSEEPIDLDADTPPFAGAAAVGSGEAVEETGDQPLPTAPMERDEGTEPQHVAVGQGRASLAPDQLPLASPM
eukprot:6033903-Pyramimonas_sp.AAC.1